MNRWEQLVAQGREILAKAMREVKEPGKKGGKGYRTKSGKWRYGAKGPGKTDIHSLYWTSADGQNSIHMGDFPSEKHASAGIGAAKKELLSQVGHGEPGQAEEIHAGRWSVEPIKE